MIQIAPERLAALDGLTLHEGGHTSFEAGHCAMEIVSWLADEGFTDAPVCASPVLRRYTIALNDRWDDGKRQQLKPYLPRMVGTGDDGKDDLREAIAARFTCERLLGPWLRLAGLDDEADALTQVDTTDITAVRRVIYDAREAAFSKRRASIDSLKAKVQAELEARGKPAAVAAAAAAAAADAVAAAVAAAVAVAVAAAVADAVAVAVAVAVAAAVAAAAAAADAVAAADGDAVAAADGYWPKYHAAYTAARAYYRQRPLPISQDIADLAAQQEPVALELLEAMIDPEPVG